MNCRTSSAIGFLALAFGGLALPACSDAPRVGPRVDAASACQGASASSLDQLWIDHFSPAAPTGCAAAGCHGDGAGGFSFGTAVEMWQAAVGQPSLGDPSMMRVAPGDPLNSALYLRLVESGSVRMPIGGPYVDAVGLEAVRGWICFGALQADNPAPSVAWIAPDTVATGSGAFTLTVHGAGFVPSSTVEVDGTPRATIFLSSTDLSAELLVDDVSAAGARTITVSNLAPGGGTSGGATLTVADSVPDNPLPSISWISPVTTIAGAGAFALSVHGTGFIPSSSVMVDGTPHDTTYVSSTELSAALLAGDVADVGGRAVTVSNPPPGGGTSGSATLSVEYPVPSVSSISPSTVAAGSGDFPVTVYGTGFFPASVVKLDGSSRTTAYVSASQLTASLLASDVVSVGSRAITVSNPTPGGGTSGAATLAVTSLPGITSLSPCGTYAGAGDFPLTIDGFNFAPDATATFDGGAVTVTFVGSTRLTASIPAALVASAPPNRRVPVVVTNPASGPSDAAWFGMASQNTTFASVQAIFNAECVNCHRSPGGGAPMSLESGSSYANLVGAASTGCSPAPRVLACGPLRTQSVLVDKILATGADPACSGNRMPTSGLSVTQQDLIVDWVAQGAPP